MVSVADLQMPTRSCVKCVLAIWLCQESWATQFRFVERTLNRDQIPSLAPESNPVSDSVIVLPSGDLISGIATKGEVSSSSASVSFLSIGGDKSKSATAEQKQEP